MQILVFNCRVPSYICTNGTPFLVFESHNKLFLLHNTHFRIIVVLLAALLLLCWRLLLLPMFRHVRGPGLLRRPVLLCGVWCVGPAGKRKLKKKTDLISLKKNTALFPSSSCVPMGQGSKVDAAHAALLAARLAQFPIAIADNNKFSFSFSPSDTALFEGTCEPNRSTCFDLFCSHCSLWP